MLDRSKMLIYLAKNIKHQYVFNLRKIRRLLRQIKGQGVIHAIGDSHTLFLQSEIFEIHHIGPATAFKLNSKKSTTGSNEKIFTILDDLSNKKNILILFVFGEIDCRIHINKARVEKKISLKKAILDTTSAYSYFLKTVKKTFPQIEICVLNVLPSGEQANIYKAKNYLKREDQLKVVTEFNKSLKSICRRLSIDFIEIFGELLDKNNNRKHEYIFDDVHYNVKALSLLTPKIKKFL